MFAGVSDAVFDDITLGPEKVTEELSRKTIIHFSPILQMESSLFNLKMQGIILWKFTIPLDNLFFRKKQPLSSIKLI